MSSTPFFTPAALPVHDPVALTRALVDIPSVSGHEAEVADAVEALLRAQPHLEVVRDGDAVLARTSQGRAERVVVAGHIDTVPVADNVPGRLEAPGEGDDPDGGDVLWGRGTTDMKGGVAMALVAACTVPEPVRDVTYVFYDCEEVESERNGLGRLARTLPGWLAADLAVLGEPTGGLVEGGCQGTLRVDVTVRGRTAHSARAWRGVNAVHGAGDVLARLQAYEPRRPVVDGLEYHEGLQAVGISGGIAGNMVPDVCTVSVNHRFAPDRAGSRPSPTSGTSSPAWTWSSSCPTWPRAPGPAWTGPRPAPSSRRWARWPAASRGPSSAGPTWPGSPRSACPR